MKSKSEKTKDKILQAAKKVFSQKGFHGSTTKEIAELAEVSEGSLFRYFKTKKELLKQILITSVLNSAEKIIKEEENHSLEIIMTKLITSRLEISKEIFPILKIIMFENTLEQDLKGNLLKEIFIPLINQVEMIFKQKQKEGKLINIDTFLMSRMFACIVFGMISLNEITQGVLFQKNILENEKEKNENLGDFISQIINIYLYGIIKRQDEIKNILPESFR